MSAGNAKRATNTVAWGFTNPTPLPGNSREQGGRSACLTIRMGGGRQKGTKEISCPKN